MERNISAGFIYHIGDVRLLVYLGVFAVHGVGHHEGWESTQTNQAKRTNPNEPFQRNQAK